MTTQEFKKFILKTENINQTGGNPDLLYSIIKLALQDARPDIVCFILCNIKYTIPDLCSVDEHRRNIMHYLSVYANVGRIHDHILHILLDNKDNKDLSKVLNTQDEHGNTCLHYAMIMDFNDLVNEYVVYGGDINIKNNRGQYIVSTGAIYNKDMNDINDIKKELDSEKKDTGNIFATINNINNVENNTYNHEEVNVTEIKNSNEDVAFSVNDENINDPNSKFTLHPVKLQDTNTNNILSETISPLSRTDYNTEKYTDALAGIFGEINNTQQNNNKPIDEYNKQTTQLIDQINNEMKQPETPNIQAIEPQKGGTKQEEKTQNKFDFSVLSPNTEELLSALLKQTKKNVDNDKQNSQLGGSKKSRKTEKSKKIRKMSSSSRSSSSEKIRHIYDRTKQTNRPTSKKKSDRKTSEDLINSIAMRLRNQATDIHERCVRKIGEILKLDLSKPEDLEKAKVFKAAIYRSVKEKHPELNNFDRAVEMEKNITEKILKSINYDDIKHSIDEKRESRKTSTDSQSDSIKSTSKSTSKSAIKSTSNTTDLSSSQSSETPDKKTKKTKKGKNESLNNSTLNNSTLSISTEIFSES